MTCFIPDMKAMFSCGNSNAINLPHIGCVLHSKIWDGLCLGSPLQTNTCEYIILDIYTTVLSSLTICILMYICIYHIYMYVYMHAHTFLTDEHAFCSPTLLVRLGC